MVITAKYPGVCGCGCNGQIVAGTKVEWVKGAKAKLVAHAARPGVASSAARASATRSPRVTSDRPWRPCGYPGCNPGYCDQCDGEGLVLTSSSGRDYRPRRSA